MRLPSLSPPRPELAGLLVVAAALNLWALGRNGWANDYYSAAVRSMSSSWHDFLYGSFDPSGVMTVDKPPLALWIQALSVKLFGFNPLSVLVPQALMGVASVALVYDLTRRRFGRAAGFTAGLVLATTPIAVAISRHNNPDALLILCCVVALWCTVRALEDGRTRWLVAAGVAVGLAFEAKMAVALLVVPGLAAAWLWVAPRGRLRALRQLLVAAGVIAAVGLGARLAPRVRAAILAAALGVLLIAPATWAAQTLGHAASPDRPPPGRPAAARPALAAPRAAARREAVPSAATGARSPGSSATRSATAAARSPSRASRALRAGSSPRIATSPGLAASPAARAR